MRGTQAGDRSRRHRNGIIPAHAGNTATQVAAATSYRDHPRACGEHSSSPSSSRKPAGSSPRMRGTLSSCCSYLVGEGIIPAHAGNTPPLTLRRPTARDHPRACGEHMRCVTVPPCRMRIIPAHAGNTGISADAPCTLWDHPRACGEHRHERHGYSHWWGSSPRMRGTRIYKVRQLFVFGIIPAHAGNTLESMAGRQ